MKILVSIIVILFLLGSSIIGDFNGLQAQDEKINSAYAQVDNQLKRRNDLIPNLVNVAKGYAKHESQVVLKLLKKHHRQMVNYLLHCQGY